MPKTARKPSSRSHFGCMQCKSRKVKCDEGKPVCLNCNRLRLDCKYSEKRWSKWDMKRRSSDHRPDLLSNESVGDPIRSTTYEYLMFHYCVYTATTIIIPGRDPSLFSVDYPKKAFRYKFLLDCIYLITSAHLNHLYPDEGYQGYVNHFNSLAANGLRTQLNEKGLTDDWDRSEAVAMASTLLSIYSLTCDIDSPFEGISKSLMPLFKGMSVFFSHLKDHQEKTSFKSLSKTATESETPSGEGYLPQIEKIFEFQKTNIEIYEPAVKSLAKITHIFSFDDYKKYRSFLMSTWIISLSADFLKLLDDLDPCALVLLARFFYVLSLDDSWFLGNYAYKHYCRVVDKIPSIWHQYLHLEPLN